MNLLLLFLALQQAQPPQAQPLLWAQVIESLERSGRAVEIVETPHDRLKLSKLAPGAPPLLQFRYLEGRRRHLFGELGLVLDDAGH